MEEALKKKTIKIIVCEDQTGARSRLTAVLRSIGFNNIESSGSLEAVLEALETSKEQVTWVITGLFPSDKLNGLNFVRLLQSQPQFGRVFTSLLIAKGEEVYALKGMECGALSYHSKNFTSQSVTEEFQVLDSVLTENDFDPKLIAAHYSREIIKSQNYGDSLLALGMSLAEAYPDNARVFAHLAESQFRNGKVSEGRDTVTQTILMDTNLEDYLNNMMAEYVDDSSLDISRVTPAQALGLNHIVVVDPDSQIQKLLWTTVMELGVPKVDVFSDGKEAWDAIKDIKKFDLVIQEWKLPKLGGSTLLQRLRRQGFLELPLILLTDSLTERDVPLLREMGISQVLKKPIEKPDLKRAIVSAMREERFPTRKRIVIRKISEALNLGKKDEAKELADKLYEMNNCTEGDRLLVEAEFLYHDDDYEGARENASSALRMGGDSLLLLNLLGKCHMRLRDFERALDYLNKAQSFSPQNLSRLCAIAEVEIEQGDLDRAEGTIEKAKNIDEEAPEVVESSAKLNLASGKVEKAREMVSMLENVSGMISYLNTKAVAHSKAGQLDEAADLYLQTIDILPNEKLLERSVVFYNLALAETKAEKYSKAMSYLKEALLVRGHEGITKKASSLLKRLTDAVAKGTQVKLITAKKVEESQEDGYEEEDDITDELFGSESDIDVTDLADAIAVEEDDDTEEYVPPAEDGTQDMAEVVGCMGLFQVKFSYDQAQQVNDLYFREYIYRPRETIQRGASFGLDRMNAGKRR